MSIPPEPSPTASPGTDPSTTVADVTCLACGCLCDDLVVRTLANKIVAIEKACNIGRDWFLNNPSREGSPPATIDGQPSTVEAALARAAEVFRRSKAPLLLVSSNVNNEVASSALALADQIGATVDAIGDLSSEQALRALQRVGRVSASLGEVKNRADTVVFWGVDPVVTHPRHWERYSVEPKGRFVPGGREDRHVLVIDDRETATAQKSDEFLPIPTSHWFEVLWVLRALLRGARLDPGRVEATTGKSLDSLQSLAERLKKARYGAWFVDSRLAREGGGTAAVEAALALVRDLNTYTRFVILDLSAPGNPTGATAVRTWQTGFASSVSLAQGFPESIPAVTSAAPLLEQGAVDAVLVIGENLPPQGISSQPTIPTIVIAPNATKNTGAGAVALDSATPGIEAGGTVIRCDGIALPLRPPLRSTRPSASDLLKKLQEQMNRL